MKEFNIDMALNGIPVETRDGRKVSNIFIFSDNSPKSQIEALSKEYNGDDNPYNQGIRATVHNHNFSDQYSFYHDGSAHMYSGINDSDLVMVDSPVNFKESCNEENV
jgi:hypothetical protein